jgi:DoxX-like family
MNQRSTSVAVSGLRWVLGLVILLESVHFALAPAAAREVANIGLPRWIPLGLGGTEAVAALLFLVPAVRVIGGYALLFILAMAVAVHLLHGQYDVGSLVVYGMATCVCMSYQKDSRGAI